MALLLPRLRFAVTVVALLAAAAAGVARGLPAFAVTPSDTVAAKGHPVVLYCSVADLDLNQVFWNVRHESEDGTVTAEFTLGPNYNRHDSYPHLLFVGDALGGEFNLRLEAVTEADAGTYACLVSDGSSQASVLLDAGARLTVADAASSPASGPECGSSSDLGAGLPHDEGDAVTLVCSSPLGVPPPQLTWERVSADNFAQLLEPQATSVADGVMTATLELTLSSLDHMAFFRCSQRHPAIDAGVRYCRQPFAEDGAQSPLEVRFKPVVTIYPKVVTAEPLATRTEELRCVAFANPPLTSGPDIVLPANKSHQVTYDGPDPEKTAVRLEITTDDVGSEFYCLAANDMGVGRDDLEVRRLSSLPAWLVMVIIGGVGFVLLIFVAICCCALCVDREEPVEGDKVTISQWRRRQSRPGTGTRKRRPADRETHAEEEGEGDYNDGFQGDMVPIEDFQGGRESGDALAPAGKRDDFHSDFETGEKGPSYQNVSEAFQSDSNNSYTQSNPSSSEPILDTDFD